ncbi:MAG: ribonuclease Y [Parachlamydiaceae bacterium]
MIELPFVRETFIFFAGLTLATLLWWILFKIRVNHFKSLAEEILKKAENEATTYKQTSLLEVKHQQAEWRQQQELFWQTERKNLLREEERLKSREEKLENRSVQIDRNLQGLEKKELALSIAKEKYLEETKKAEDLQDKLTSNLEMLAGLSSEDAKNILIQRITDELKQETAHLIKRTKKKAEEEAEFEASKIIATAINRLASSTVSELTVTTVTIPNEEMKGRIIGREGRNIRALERATGVNFMVDDTPGAVVLSGFDPLRKYVAKLAISELMLDGRIHPTRIEEVVEKARKNAQKQIQHYGEDAALRVGAMNLHPEIIILLGKLKFRYSYGQNVLDHSVEVAHLMGLMAAELGLNIRLAKRIGLLHDIGKALSHDVEGTHAIIGHDYALKYGEPKEVANGIGCHHQEMEPLTVEGSLCSAADAISASRPGVRIEAVEEYIRRLKKLEDLAYEFPEIETAFALQAGREIRVAVLPDAVDDAGLTLLARNLTKRIENELDYSGKIKVTVIREKRAIEYAV